MQGLLFSQVSSIPVMSSQPVKHAPTGACCSRWVDLRRFAPRQVWWRTAQHFSGTLATSTAGPACPGSDVGCCPKIWSSGPSMFKLKPCQALSRLNTFRAMNHQTFQRLHNYLYIICYGAVWTCPEWVMEEIRTGQWKRSTRVMSLSSDFSVLDSASAHDLMQLGPQYLGVRLYKHEHVSACF